MAISLDALHEVTRVFHFEYWLRFYFIEERDGSLYIHLTPEQTQQLQATYPDFWDLVERVQGEALSPEVSQRCVVEFLQVNFEGQKYSGATVLQILDSKEFSAEMYLFDTWVTVHEEQLSQKIYGFDYWMHVYAEWKNSDRTQQLRQSLLTGSQAEKATVH